MKELSKFTKIFTAVFTACIATASVGYAAGNHAPIANPLKGVVVKQNNATEFTLTGSDIDNDPLTFMQTTPPLHGMVAIDPVTGRSLYTPNISYYGSDTFYFKVNDGKTSSTRAQVALTIKPVNLSLVKQAKALVLNSRTWLNSFNQLKNPSNAFAKDAKVISETLGDDSSALLGITADALNQVLVALQTAHKNGKPLPTSVSIKNTQGQIIGKASVSATLTPKTNINIQFSKVLGSSLKLTAAFDQAIDAATKDWVNGAATAVLTGTVQNTKVKIDLNSISFKLAVDKNTLNKNGYPIATGATFNGNISIASKRKVGNAISGAVNIDLIAMTANKETWAHNDDGSIDSLSLSHLKLGPMQVQSATGSSAGLGIELNIDSAATFDTYAFLSGGNQIWVHNSVPGKDLADFTTLAKKFGITKLTSAYYYPKNIPWASTSGIKTYLSGQDSSGFWKSFMTADVPTKAQSVLESYYPSSPWIVAVLPYSNLGYSSYCGSSSCQNGTTYISANLLLDKKESAEHFLKANFTLTGNLSLAGYPAADFSLMFDRSGYQSANANILLSYNTGQLAIKVTKPNTTDPSTGDILITDTAGAELSVHLQQGVPTGELRVDGKPVGLISNGLIRYNDGTFEAL